MAKPVPPVKRLPLPKATAGDCSDRGRAGVEALLVTPAPDAYLKDGFPLVVFAHLTAELDEETVFWRQAILAIIVQQTAPAGHRALSRTAQGSFLKLSDMCSPRPYRDELD